MCLCLCLSSQNQSLSVISIRELRISAVFSPLRIRAICPVRFGSLSLAARPLAPRLCLSSGAAIDTSSANLELSVLFNHLSSTRLTFFSFLLFSRRRREANRDAARVLRDGRVESVRVRLALPDARRHQLRRRRGLGGALRSAPLTTQISHV